VSVEGKKLWQVLEEHPELKKDPMCDPDRFPRAFEENLLMAIKKNHLAPFRMNLDDKLTMDGVIKTTDNIPLFFYDAEYTKDELFDKEGKFKFWDIHIPIEKLKFFKRFKNSVYVRGNLKRVLILRDTAIINGRLITMPNCKHGTEPNVVVADRAFISVHTQSALTNNHMKVVPIEKWLHAVKEMFALDLYLVG